MFETDIEVMLGNCPRQEPPKSVKIFQKQNLGYKIKTPNWLKTPNPTWQESCDQLNASLARLGLANYEIYLQSEWWIETCRRYQKSKLLQACLVCGQKKYDLWHTSYEHLGTEDISRLLPICNHHRQKLHEYLTEHGLPCEASWEAISQLKFQNTFHYNRKLLAYRKCLLNHKLSELGLSSRWESSRIGTKSSNKTDKKMIFIQDKRFYFDAKTGMIQLGYNGREITFDSFCGKLTEFLSQPSRTTRDSVRLIHEPLRRFLRTGRTH